MVRNSSTIMKMHFFLRRLPFLCHKWQSRDKQYHSVQLVLLTFVRHVCSCDLSKHGKFQASPLCFNIDWHNVQSKVAVCLWHSTHNKSPGTHRVNTLFSKHTVVAGQSMFCLYMKVISCCTHTLSLSICSTLRPDIVSRLRLAPTTCM